MFQSCLPNKKYAGIFRSFTLERSVSNRSFSNLYAELGDIRKLLDYSGHSQVSTVMKSYVFSTEDSANEIRRSIDACRPKQIIANNEGDGATNE